MMKENFEKYSIHMFFMCLLLLMMYFDFDIVVNIKYFNQMLLQKTPSKQLELSLSPM